MRKIYRRLTKEQIKRGVIELTENGRHIIAKIHDNKEYFFCDPTQGSPFAFNKKSLSFCWRPY